MHSPDKVPMWLATDEPKEAQELDELLEKDDFSGRVVGVAILLMLLVAAIVTGLLIKFFGKP